MVKLGGGGCWWWSSLFVDDVYVSFWQMLLTQLSVKDREVAYMIYYIIIVKLY